MSKRNKKNTRQIHAPATVSPTPVKSGLLGAMLSKVGVSSSEDLLKNLPQEKTKELLELTKKLEAIIASNEEEQKELKDERLFLDERKTALEQEQLQLEDEKGNSNKQSTILKKKQQSLESKSQQLLNLENKLIEQKANAEAGFAEEYQQHTTRIKIRYDEIKNSHQEFQTEQAERHADIIQEDKQHAAELLKKEKQHFDKIREEIRQQEQQLTKEKKALEETKQRLEEKYLFQEAEVEKLRQDTIVDYTSKNRELIKELELIKSHRERDEVTIDELRENLSAFKELQREAKLKELGSPVEVLQHMDKLEADLKSARQKLKGRSEDDLEEELEHYRELSDDIEGKLTDLRQEYDELRLRESGHKLSVREKLELQKNNDLLELSNQTLTHSIDNLRSEIDDLIEKQQSKDAFPQLLTMDRELSELKPARSINNLSEFVEDLQYRLAQAEDTILYYDISVIRKFVAGLAMSQLHVFQGISGTGKTSLVKAFAKAVGGHVTTVPVQAGWRDRDDLLGHYNAFEKRYYEKECLQGIYKSQTKQYKNKFNIVLLDEMNLSRPEQYFAEFLSALEMRKGQQEIVLMDASITNAPEKFIEGRKVSLSNNLWFMGTANHDETTFEFADKTHDRAFVMDLERNEKPKDWRPNSSSSKRWKPLILNPCCHYLTKQS